MTTGTEVENLVASALYNHAVDSAQSDIEKIAFDAKELPYIFSKLKVESETAQVLILSSYLEDRVNYLLAARMKHLDSVKSRDAMFGGTGPLGTLGNRLLLAYQLGWLTAHQKKKLDAFRKIRNEFAHNAFRASYSDETIVSHLNIIDADIPGLLEHLRKVIVENGVNDPFVDRNELPKRIEILSNFLILLVDTFEQLLVLPEAEHHRVIPKDIYGDDFDAAPECLKSLKKEKSSALLYLFEKN